ncbi:nuclear transport factor 2 family protein [Longimicrobium sp.]|uniref:nuclear transport factor 2 family protein n=1 Tax=Longimicrobium sp. TaxID=2029185 RepID=UPI002E37AF0C|nr:nuclear transport factor 2 family protein [Longimicrobium sp.]HEX6040553.1 nuclear transport factor 2 family protein [Longimicrobium sp.]
MTDTESANVQTARRYLEAISRGAPWDEMAAFFTEDVVQEEFPNRLVPGGARRTLCELEEANARGRAVITAQRYDVRNAVASGDHVALEVLWTGTLAVPFGSLPAGGDMVAHFGVFLEFRDGRIATQRNYDCFEPF